MHTDVHWQPNQSPLVLMKSSLFLRVFFNISLHCSKLCLHPQNEQKYSFFYFGDIATLVAKLLAENFDGCVLARDVVFPSLPGN